MVAACPSCTPVHWLGGYRATNGILTSALKSSATALILMNIAMFSAWISYHIMPDETITASFSPMEAVSSGKS